MQLIFHRLPVFKACTGAVYFKWTAWALVPIILKEGKELIKFLFSILSFIFVKTKKYLLEVSKRINGI